MRRFVFKDATTATVAKIVDSKDPSASGVTQRETKERGRVPDVGENLHTLWGSAQQEM